LTTSAVSDFIRSKMFA